MPRKLYVSEGKRNLLCRTIFHKRNFVKLEGNVFVGKRVALKETDEITFVSNESNAFG